MTHPPDVDHQVPHGVDGDTVDAVGKLTKALETAERARGHLYAFHQLIGEADRRVEASVQMLRDAGHSDFADRLDKELFGRNVLEGRWTFQIVEEFDDGYWTQFRELESAAREQLTGGRRHLREAGMKEEHRTRGREDHTSRP